MAGASACAGAGADARGDAGVRGEERRKPRGSRRSGEAARGATRRRPTQGRGSATTRRRRERRRTSWSRPGRVGAAAGASAGRGRQASRGGAGGSGVGRVGWAADGWSPANGWFVAWPQAGVPPLGGTPVWGHGYSGGHAIGTPVLCFIYLCTRQRTRGRLFATSCDTLLFIEASPPWATTGFDKSNTVDPTTACTCCRK